MKKIQIEKIKITENVRKDYGDLTELAASIKMHGLRNPVELNQDNELVDGFRRVKAAKAAGLKEIPYFVNEEELGKTESQLISGIFQKNLNPIEEGKAFRKYMDQEKIKIAELAKKISKRENYIEKRLELVKTSPEVQKALIERKIQMGHALLLARFTKDDSKKFLRKIIQEKPSVEDARESLGYSNFTARLSDAKFDMKACKDCKFNGSQQAELFETGKILSGNCMNPGCFQKKVKELIKQRIEQFKDILVPGDRYQTPNGYVSAESTWALEDKGICKPYMNQCRKDRENYLVKIGDDGSLQEYFKIPSKKKKSPEGSKVAMKDEEVREEKREQVLSSKINEFKTKFLIDKTIEVMGPKSIQTKSLVLLRLIQNSNYSDIDYIAKELGNLVKRDLGGSPNVKNIFNADDEELDNAIALISQSALRRVDLKELILISRDFEVDVKKHFGITEDYLKLYTKVQLLDLIDELKIGTDQKYNDVKKDEIIEFILSRKLKGKVPKIMI